MPPDPIPRKTTVNLKELLKQDEIDKAKEKAERRRARMCPVLKVCRQALRNHQPIDTQHAIDVLLIELEGWALAGPTREILEQLKQYDYEGGQCGE